MSLCVEEGISDKLKRNNGGQIGIDVGLKEFYTDNFGNIIANPRILKSLTVKLCREQKRLSKTRLDFLNKETTQLCRENQTIADESLQVKNLMRNHKLAKAISDVSWREFFRQLQYKSFLYGCGVIKVPTFYPSSQTCSCCGFQNAITKNLSVRNWRCPKCGTFHDRDKNAAKNILQKALESKNSA